MSRDGKIGPGRLVLVVGPSGAGKDTLIGIARDACAQERRIVFPRRLVNREASASEDHDTFDEEAFLAGEAAGRYPLSWRAHGLCYALPPAIVDAVREGCVVVSNVSRAVIPMARDRFAHVSVVLVSAPPEVLRERLAARGRNEDVAARLARGGAYRMEPAADLEIANVGDPAASAAVLKAFIGQKLPSDLPMRQLSNAR